MSTYNEYMRSTTSDIELLRVFSLSSEFQYIAVRPEERLELEKLLERVPIPVKESIEEPSAKINVLLQSYISRLKLDGFSLSSDMVYVTQSASRIMRSLFEVSLKRGWAQVAERCLNFCKMIDRRMWSTQSPLRQFKNIPEALIKKLEKKDFTLERLYELNSQEIGELVRFPSQGKPIYGFVHQFPKLDLTASVQPITRTLLRVELTITPDFEYIPDYHGNSLSFWVLVEDVDGEQILHHEMFVLKEKFSNDEHYLSFTVPLYEPLPPQYFIKIISDRWIGSESLLPISFRNLILPEKYPPHNELLDLQPLPIAALKNLNYESIYKEIKFNQFNPIQTQVFNTLYNTDLNTLICAPTGSGKTICAEFAILHEFSKENPGKIVYITPFEELVNDRMKDWQERIGKKLNKIILQLTGETTTDIKSLEKGDIIISTPENWDVLSRRWKQRKGIQNIKLFIIDEIHLIGSLEIGSIQEVIVSRMRYISQQLKITQQQQQQQEQEQEQEQKQKEEKQNEKVIIKNSKENPIRIIALSTSLANATDLGEWIGATPQSLFNFHPNVRPVPLEIHIQGFDNPNYGARMLSMTKPLLYSVSHHASGDKPVIIFVPSRKLSKSVAKDLIIHCQSEDNPKRYIHCTEEDLIPFLKNIKSKSLKETLSLGVSFYNEGLSKQEREIVKTLFNSGAIQILISTHTMCWELNNLTSNLVIIMGTQYYEGKEHRYADYSISDVLQMMGRAGKQLKDENSKCVLFTHSPKKEFYKKFIYEPLPIESHLDHFLHDHLNSEIVTKTIENKQDAVDYITWTFYYRRLTQNPNYYNLSGVTRRHLSDHLSELIEDTLNDLQQSKCIIIEEGETTLKPLNLGMVAAYYNIKYTSIELFNFSLSSKTKMRGLIEILSNSSEFERLPLRQGEEKILRKMGNHMPVKITKQEYTNPSTKANILLQSYFSRTELSSDLLHDQEEVIIQSPKLLQAMVDVISSSGWLTPALAAMELSQMISQAMWDNDSVFKQLPHFSSFIIQSIQKEFPECETIFDLIDLQDNKRKLILKELSSKQLKDVAQVCNRYPNIEVGFTLSSEEGEIKLIENSKNNNKEDEDEEEEDKEKHYEVIKTSNIIVNVTLEREFDGDIVPPIHSLYFPKEKIEGWWVLIGDSKSNQLLAIKKVNFQKNTKVKLDLNTPPNGEHNLTLYLMSDSWIGCDQEYPLKLSVQGEIEDTEMNES